MQKKSMAIVNINFDLTSYYLSLFRICLCGYEMGNYISGVYSSRNSLVHEGTKCILMSGNVCCHSPYHLLSQDISMTAHSIKILSFLCKCESLSPELLQENRATAV